MSDYEAIRQSNIKRNEKFLESIGFEKVNKPIRCVSSSGAGRAQQGEVVLRRSLRNAHTQLTDNVYKEVNIATLSRSQSSKKRLCSHIENEDIGNMAMEKLKKVKPVKTIVTSGGLSCKDCDANLKVMLNPDVLGNRLPSFGKLAAVTWAAATVVPKFSKYSGVLPWKNCVFVWVNIEKQNYSGGLSGYNNEFLTSKDLCTLTWYGNAKMTMQCDVSKYLMGSSASSHSSRPNTVLLMTRLVSDNYTCLGRLQCNECIDIGTTQQQCLKYSFQLLDYDSIKVKSYFKEILAANRRE